MTQGSPSSYRPLRGGGGVGRAGRPDSQFVNRRVAGTAFQVVLFWSRLCMETWENTKTSKHKSQVLRKHSEVAQKGSSHGTAPSRMPSRPPDSLGNPDGVCSTSQNPFVSDNQRPLFACEAGGFLLRTSHEHLRTVYNPCSIAPSRGTAAPRGGEPKRQPQAVSTCWLSSSAAV